MSLQSLHPLLLRQLRRVGLDASAPAAAGDGFGKLLLAVSRAYCEADQDRYLLERSQEISSRELTAQAEVLRINEARLSSLLSLSSDWVWEQDADLRITYVSEGWRTCTGVDTDRLKGQLREDIDDLDASDDDRAAFRAALRERKPFRDITVGMRLADKHLFMRISGEPLFDGQGSFLGYRGVGSNVTEAMQAARRAERMAHFDTLTGLPNRALLNDSLWRAVGRAERQGTRVALVFIDLDGFKYINDHLGHAAGDELLCVMARRLEGTLRDGDMVARIGGDEFVVLLEPAGDTRSPGPAGECRAARHDAAAARALASMTQRLLEVIAEPVVLQGRSFHLSGSLGVSVYGEDAHDATALLRNADAAMYVAKEGGKGRVHFYTAALAAEAAELFAMETDLSLAVERDQMRLQYQPKYRVSDGKLMGVEALLRWQHPERGLVGPGAFIELAERRGLIVKLGRWVLDAACRQMSQWRAAGLQVPMCAVNLSAHHFASPSVLEDLEGALSRWRLPPQALTIEITESAVMADPARAHRLMTHLRERGLGIAIDDFGTGYSSLAYLKRFPVQTLKIDRSFVRGLPQDASDSAIIRAVVALAHSLGLNVVAEGVETAEQLAHLRRIGCDQVQGFLLSHPLHAEDIGAEPASVLLRELRATMPAALDVANMKPLARQPLRT